MKNVKGLMVAAMLLICFTLTSCAYNAAVSGAQAVYNRQSIKKNINDNYTTMQAYHAIDTYGNIYKDTHITIATFNDSVLLAGQVRNSEQKEELQRIIQPEVGGRTIYNFLEIGNPSSALTRTSDSWITAKIKSQLIAINDADPTQIKVVTENGTVYLMGIVQPEQADIAVDVARATDGVQRVVKIFSYITITKRYKQ